MNAFSPSARPVGAVISLPQGLRILVVEDHADTRRALEALLKMMGYRVTVADGMKAALEAADGGGKFDLLLSDLGLRDGSGWELLCTMEENGWRPPQAVAMSGLCSGTAKARSRAAGFRAHLVKPFPPEELESVINAAMAEELTVAG